MDTQKQLTESFQRLGLDENRAKTAARGGDREFFLSEQEDVNQDDLKESFTRLMGDEEKAKIAAAGK